MPGRGTLFERAFVDERRTLGVYEARGGRAEPLREARIKGATLTDG